MQNNNIQKIVHSNGYMLFVGIITGVVTAFAAMILHGFVEACIDLSHMFADLCEATDQRCLVIFILPMLGIFLSYFIQKHWCGPTFGKSLAPLILRLDRGKGTIPFYETYYHIFTSAFCVGFGGSAGLEAPSVLTGAAIGSNVAKIFHIKHVPRSMIVSCGAAAAISAIFDSPIAGVLFTVEALLPEFNAATFIPPLLASGIASITVHAFYRENCIFFMNSIEDWESNELFYVFLCGAICSLVGAYIIKSTVFTGKLIHKIKDLRIRLWTGGFVVCVVFLLFPFLRSQGYESIEQLLICDMNVIHDTPYFLSFLPGKYLPFVILTAAILIKPLVSALTIEAGGDGGIFAPTMFIGAFTGFTLARVINMTGIGCVSECNFAAFGMCGVFTAVMRAPLAGMFLAIETTGAYGLTLPMMIVTGSAWAFGTRLEPHSIYKKSLIARGLISDDQMTAHLMRYSVSQCIIQSSIIFAPTTTIHQALDEIQHSHCNDNQFPVLDENNNLLGIVTMEQLFTAIMDSKIDTSTIGNIMKPPVATINDTDTMEQAFHTMNAHSVKYIPVISKDTDKFLGIVSKDSIADLK